MELERSTWVRIAAVGAAAVVVAGYLLRGCLSGDLAYARVGPRPSANRKTLVLLHGYGAAGDDMVSFADELAAAVPDLSVLVPVGPTSVNATGHAWLPTTTSAPNRQALAELVAVEVDRISQRIWKLIGYARGRGTACSDIYVGGFSQGGRIAAEVALRAPADCALGGLLVLSGGQIKEVELPDASGRPPMRVLVSHGTHDTVVNRAVGTAVAQHFAQGGHDVRFVSFEGGHQIPPPVSAAVAGFLRGETVGEAVEK
jgi:phospholipase/carboxylesterase